MLEFNFYHQKAYMDSMQLQEIDKTNKECDFRMIEETKISLNECFQKEKQILVDPLSLRSSSAATVLNPPPLKPPNQRFLSTSLPNSSNSSPRFASPHSEKEPKGESQESPCQDSNMTHKFQDLLQQEVELRKSKSCGDGRAYSPSHEFEHWLNKLSFVENDNKNFHYGSFSKPEVVKESPKKVKEMKAFKCGSLCLYLPTFGGNKVKQVKTKENAMSRTVSLENFECGSWASAAKFLEIEDSYFDLPLELIKCSGSEVNSPVAASFVYEKELKGVLKNGSSRGSARKSDASPRHVRFSTSTSTSGSYPASPVSCISPRLRKARDDFNAFLAAAQSA